MRFLYAISFILSLQSFCLNSLAQTKPASNVWTFVPFSKNKVYFYKGDLQGWNQVSVINLWDSVQMRKLAEDVKGPDKILLVLKGTEEGGFAGMVDLFETADRVNTKWEIQKLNAKEKELFELSDLHVNPSSDLKAPTVSVSMPGNRLTLYLRIKNDGSVWYKTDTSFNENSYTAVNKQEKSAFSAFIDNYQKTCADKKITESIYIVGGGESKYAEFSFIVNELEKHKIYTYNLITAPD